MNKRSVVLYFFLTDGLAALGAWVLFYYLKVLVGEHVGGGFFTLFGSGLMISTAWLALYAFFGFYVDVLRKSRTKEVFTLFRISLVGMLILVAALFYDDYQRAQGANTAILFEPRLYLNVARYFVVHFLLAASVKLAVMTRSKNALASGKLWFNTVLIGSGPSARELLQEIQGNNGHLGLRFIGYVGAEHTNGSQTALPWLGRYDQLAQLAESHQIEQALISIEPTEHQLIQGILNELEGTGVRVAIAADMYQILLGSVRVSHIYGSPLIEINRQLMPVWQQVTKRAIDIFVSLCVLILGSPMYLVVSLLTKFSSPGPIFYRQERIGKGGLPFKIIKFRSMYINAEAKGPALSSDFDPRVTPWGRFMRKTRLDEFPQFWNVLVGDMSLVGPRPERQFFIDQIVQVAPHYKHLNRVRPGITSLGQVKYGYASNVEEMVRRLKYDILYVENMSLAMDFRIILYTVLTVLKGSGK